MKNELERATANIGKSLKSVRDYGYDFAQANDAESTVDFTGDIPIFDYYGMVADGIENPDQREYWRGYNIYVTANQDCK